MAGYPRVIGYAPGTGIYGYVAGADVAPPMLPVHPHMALPVHPAPHPAVHSPPWRPMMAPGSPPLGEGHVPMPLNPETFNGTWGGVSVTGAAPAGTTITFSARPQKPFKTARLLVNPSGPNVVGARVIGQVFVGTDLQQGELGNIDLQTIGAGGSFDTWVSLKQAEPGVWIRLQVTLTAFPVGTDFIVVTCSSLGHYLH